MSLSYQLYEIVRNWQSKCYLDGMLLKFDDLIYTAASEEFLEDYRRWYPDDEAINFHKLNLPPQLHAVLTYRIARHFFLQSDEETAAILSAIGRVNGQIEIYYSSVIGVAFKINHGVGSVIGARCHIGRNCTIYQNVILGDKNGGRPWLGDYVNIYPGAKVLGDIKIGNHCVIGANAVCLHDAPDHAVLIGASARNIAKREV